MKKENIIQLKTEIAKLKTEKIALEKDNIRLRILADTQERLMDKLKIQNEENILLLDAMIKERNNER